MLGCARGAPQMRLGLPIQGQSLQPVFMERIAMSDPTERREAVRRNAQSHFTHTERRDELVRQEIEKERAAVDAKTAKLKALRLAKEANEREEAERLAAEREKSGAAAPKSARRKRTRTAEPAKARAKTG